MNTLLNFLHSIYSAVIHFPADVISSWPGWTTGQKFGFVAIGFSNIAYVPQFYRIWTTRSARDVSFGMYALLMTGAMIWIVYALLTGERPILINNYITLSMRGSVLILKVITDRFRQKHPKQKTQHAPHKPAKN